MLVEQGMPMTRSSSYRLFIFFDVFYLMTKTNNNTHEILFFFTIFDIKFKTRRFRDEESRR